MDNLTISNISSFNILISTFNLISFFFDIIAILFCLITLFIIIYRLIRNKSNRRQKKIDISIILSINTLSLIIIKSILQIIHVTIPTLMKDFNLITEINERRFNQIRVYLLYSFIGILYWSYVLLAFFRFVRIIYPTKLYFHRSPLYLYILIPCQYLFIFLSILPILLISNAIHINSNEAYYDIAIKPFYYTTYPSTITFSLPCTVISIFYTLIGRKIKQVSVIRPYQERNRRDFLVVRRMLLNIMILCIVAIPYIVIYIYDTIIDRFDSLIHRVQWLSSSIGSFLFSIILPLIITQLRDLLKSNTSTVSVNNVNVIYTTRNETLTLN